jgi:hypothetical protein
MFCFKKAKAEAEVASRLVKPQAVPVKQPSEVKPAEVKAAPVAPAKTPEPERSVSVFEQNLLTLESMGFTDRKKRFVCLFVFSITKNCYLIFVSVQHCRVGAQPQLVVFHHSGTVELSINRKTKFLKFFFCLNCFVTFDKNSQRSTRIQDFICSECSNLRAVKNIEE